MVKVTLYDDVKRRPGQQLLLNPTAVQAVAANVTEHYGKDDSGHVVGTKCRQVWLVSGDYYFVVDEPGVTEKLGGQS